MSISVKLSPEQLRKLKKGQTVQLKHSDINHPNGHQFRLSNEIVKKLIRSVKNKKGSRFSLSPAEIQSHFIKGGDLLDDIDRALNPNRNGAKEFFENKVGPTLEEVGKKIAGPLIDTLGPLGGMAGSALGSFADPVLGPMGTLLGGVAGKTLGEMGADKLHEVSGLGIKKRGRKKGKKGGSVIDKNFTPIKIDGCGIKRGRKKKVGGLLGPTLMENITNPEKLAELERVFRTGGALTPAGGALLPAGITGCGMKKRSKKHKQLGDMIPI